MKEISKKTIYLDNFDVNVKCYFSLAEIQQIVNAVVKFNTWAERQENVVMLTLFHATDIGEEKLNKLNSEVVIESGLFEAVKNCIVNFDEIEKALTYTESFGRNMKIVLDQTAPQINDLLDLVVKKYGKAITKE